MTVATLAGTLPGSGRPFRMAVADRALGVWVAPRLEGGDPFVAIVTNPARNLADARDLSDVADYVLDGVAW